MTSGLVAAAATLLPSVAAEVTRPQVSVVLPVGAAVSDPAAEEPAKPSDAPQSDEGAHAPSGKGKTDEAPDRAITTGAVSRPAGNQVPGNPTRDMPGAGASPTGPDGLGADAPTSGLRGPQDLPNQTFTAPDINPYVPFGRGSEDKRDAEDDFGVPTSREEIQSPVVVPEFDLFEGPDGRPTPPANLRTSPASPDDTNPQAGGKTQGPANGRVVRNVNGTAANDPLLRAAAGGLTPADLTLPAGAVRSIRPDTLVGRANLPIATALRGAIPLARDDPFAPVGMRAGSFVLYSTLDQSIGASDNLAQSVRGKSGVFSDTVASFRLLSDWSQNQADINAVLGYRHNFSGEPAAEPTVSLDGRLRLDVDRLTTATLRGGFQYSKDDPTATSAENAGTTRQDLYTMSLGAELKHQFGLFDAGLDVSAVREATSDATTVNGIAPLDETFTTYTAALRTGYEISPAISPYAQASLGRRIFDTDKTANGTERNALIEALRLGIAFDFSEKLLGEIAAGYAWNVPDADTLSTIASPTVDASISWSPQRGTNVVLTAGTTFDPDTNTSSTSTIYQGSLAVRHKATSRTELSAAVSASYRDSDTAADREKTYAVETGFTYWLNRSLAFTGLLRHSQVASDAAGADYSENTARIGIKLQR